MNDAHLHLLINHLPILGAFLSVPVLLVSLWRNRESTVLGVAVMLLVLAAAACASESRACSTRPGSSSGSGRRVSSVMAARSGEVASAGVSDGAGCMAAAIR